MDLVPSCSGTNTCSDDGLVLLEGARTGTLHEGQPASLEIRALLGGLMFRQPFDSLAEVHLDADVSWTGTLTYTFVYEPVPEPGTAVLLLVGLAGIASRSRSS